MKTFAVTHWGYWHGGCSVVVANDRAHAARIMEGVLVNAFHSVHAQHRTDYYDDIELIEVPYGTGLMLDDGDE